MKLCMGCMNEIEDQHQTCPLCGYDETTLDQESYYLDPGTVIGGRYIAGRVLDYGGYCVTYLGWDAEHSRKAVIREYLPSDFSTRGKGDTEVTIYSGDALEQYEEGLSTFLNEGNTIEHLTDLKGIARVYDCIAENETGYIVHEYLEGQSLKEILETGKKYEFSEAMEILHPLLDGLTQIHGHQVMHYDISPENVMITQSGEVKLINFGATKYSTSSNSKSLAIILKPGYAPEEQYRSMGEKGPWSDVYASAALMYRMLTGVVPEESVERAMIDNLKAPSEFGISLSKASENAILNALNVFRENRTASAEQFLKELSAENVKRIVEKRTKLETGKFPVWAKGMIAGLVCVIIAGSILIYKNKGSNTIVSQTAAMIDTYDMDAEQAKTSVEKLGANCRVQYIPDAEDPEGTIWMQSVEQGKAIDKDTTVVLSVSGGNSKLTIPNDWIDQKKYDEIVDRLKKYNIQYEIEEDASEEKKGYHLTSKVFIDDTEITKEQIEQGSAVFQVGQNQKIKLCYYKPDDSNFDFEIPDFTTGGMTIHDVEKIKSATGEVTLKELENLGYQPVPVYGVGMELQKVVKQSQSGTVRISAKKSLEVYYCGKVLNYKAGDDPTELIRTFKEAGVETKVLTDTYSNTCPKGTIYSVIYPGRNGDRFARAGDTVTIHLSMGSKPVVTTRPQAPSQPQVPSQPQRTPAPDKNQQHSTTGI